MIKFEHLVRLFKYDSGRYLPMVGFDLMGHVGGFVRGEVDGYALTHVKYRLDLATDETLRYLYHKRKMRELYTYIPQGEPEHEDT